MFQNQFSNAKQAGLDQGSVTSCSFNFSDSHYLNQHNLNKIVEFFQDYILLDEEYLSFEFDKFQQQPALKSQFEDDQSIQQFPKFLEKSLETEDDTKQIIMHFPNIQVDFPSLNFKQSYYLSQQQFQNMLISNFESLDQIVFF
ncbi:hypothetical protein PPERSA_05725 [Pseudocohnilembus persalinus]|uniref:Uncharacterized protein n=1 Tax=Pseudocohnilembus persalinus TaxID=266149 RepID=A0A0V0QI56_PSEPJ|nr:hypothetical protein PPERSA_05725 [Pseudocohnilembus persalinus]|eukprot:KRX01886.1 hypothetical protein PPERSA_05725 [Pseudocohnilembus persalinus]